MLRFYVEPGLELRHDFWIHDEGLLSRMHDAGLSGGMECVLFNGTTEDRLYKVVQMHGDEAHVRYITDYARQLPPRELYLAWAVEDTDAESIVRYGTEHGVSHFLPYYDELVASARPVLDETALRRAAIHGAEKSQRSDLPIVREAMTLATLVEELRETATFICATFDESAPPVLGDGPVVCLVAPERGFSNAEETLLSTITLHNCGVGEGVHTARQIAETMINIVGSYHSE